MVLVDAVVFRLHQRDGQTTYIYYVVFPPMNTSPVQNLHPKRRARAMLCGGESLFSLLFVRGGGLFFLLEIVLAQHFGVQPVANGMTMQWMLVTLVLDCMIDREVEGW